MKNQLFKGLFISAAFALPYTTALAEFRVGNGGDAMAAEFIDMADETLVQVERLAQLEDSPLPSDLSLAELKQRIATTIVYTADKTMVGNHEVDALNFPEEKKIILNRARWKSMSFSLKGMKTLLLHEYISMTGANDKSYQISNHVVRKVFNGGTKGELWYLKDLGDKRQSNPFFAAWLEIKGSFLKGSKERYFQDGLMMSSQLVDKSRAHCRMVLSGASINVGGAEAVIRLPVVNSIEVVKLDSAAKVELDFQKQAIVTSFTCTSGSEENVTVKHMLDSLSKDVAFQHQGRNSLNVCLP